MFVITSYSIHYTKLYETIDGIRIDFPDGWALVRASNTQNVIVLRFEAESAEGLARMRSEVEGAIAGWLGEMQGK